MLFLLIACTPDEALTLPDAVAVISDSGNQRVVYTQLVDRAVVYELDLLALHPEDCGVIIDGAEPSTCIAFQTDPEVVTDADGTHDELVYTYDRQSGDDLFERAVIERVRLSDAPTVSWRLDALDFATNYAGQGDLCTDVDPCAGGADQTNADAALRCRLAHSHDFDILAEDETSVDLLIADSTNERALTVHLDKATTCGVVTDVMADPTLPAWAVGRTPNDIDTVPISGSEPGALVTFRSTNGDVTTGGLDGGGDGNGLVVFYVPGGAGWEEAWRFPSEGFLNSPHDSSIVTAASGAQYLVIAHSNGNGQHLQADWTLLTDSAGSITVAALSEDLTQPPDYRFDAVLPPSVADEGFGFLRSVHPYESGVDGPAPTAGLDWILADSGCMSVTEGCPHDPSVRAVQFDLEDPMDGPGNGAFDPSRAQQLLLPVVSAGVPLDCGFAVPYVADLVWTTGGGVGESGEGCE